MSMNTVEGLKKKFHFLQDGGEMGALTRAYDWSQSPVGPIEGWPQTLKTTVGTLLHSGFPMFLWWGDDMIQFYNDAYRPSLGDEGKHPRALGQKAIDCWPEIWSIIYPLIDQVRTSGKSFFLEDQLVPIFRNGKIEDVYWSFSYSAVIGDNDEIEGVLVICTETTKKVNTLIQIEKAQRDLAQSEHNLRSFILQAPIAMCILKGPKHIVEIANDRMYDLWGYPREAMLGEPVFDHLVDARYEGFETLLDNVFRTGETYTAYGAPVTLNRAGRKQLLYVHFVYEALREADGTITGTMVVAVDVTEELITRKKLEESENKIRALVQSAPFPIGVYEGTDMRITMMNQAIIDVWGKGNELIGKTYHEVLPELEGQQIYQQLDRVFRIGEPFHARNQRVDLVVDGKPKTFYFNYSFTPLFDHDGKVYGVMNTAADVTDLNIAKLKVEQSEQNFRNMVKQAPVAMTIMTGPDHVVEVANDLILELWGKKPDAVLNKPIFEGLPESKGQGLEELLHNVFTTGQPFVANELPIVLLRNGRREKVYQNFVYEPYRDSNGQILGVLAITIDVTSQVLARHQIEEVVKERTESLRRTNAELSQFAYITSHDLQEPARKINTFIEMLWKALGTEIDPRAKTYLQKIDNSAARMLTLIRDVLAFSQLSISSYDFVSVDLNKILEEVSSDFELLIDQKHCTVMSDKLPVIDAIPVQMSQLFSNLVSNALKFATADKENCLTIKAAIFGPEGTAESHTMKATDAYCRIDFQDTGIGFNQANAEQIFDIFQRLHSKFEYQGTGIGLAMCKKIAENHGGQIFATSSPGAGATFTVILPLKHNRSSPVGLNGSDQEKQIGGLNAGLKFDNL
jgi:PAS domain S-box-containing protein